MSCLHLQVLYFLIWRFKDTTKTVNGFYEALIVCTDAFGTPLERKSPRGQNQFAQDHKSSSYEVQFDSKFFPQQIWHTF